MSSSALLGGLAAGRGLRLHRRSLADPGALAVHLPAGAGGRRHRPGRHHHLRGQPARVPGRHLASDSSTHRPSPVVGAALRDRPLGRGHDQQHQLHRRPRRPVHGRGTHRGPDPGRHLADQRRGLLCADGGAALRGPGRRRWPGFLPWNFHPARVFIGTTGVMAVGYALAVLSILGTAKVAVALLVLGVPIIDTFWIITRRLASGARPSRPTAATSTTGCWTWVSPTGVPSCSSTPSARAGGRRASCWPAAPDRCMRSWPWSSARASLLLLVTFRSGADEALEASSYPDGADTATASGTGQQDRGPNAPTSTPPSRSGRRP